MKTVIISGATSMIGVALIKKCISQGVKVYALVRRNSSKLSRLPQSDLIKIVECELSGIGSLNSISEQCDVFYHFAWDAIDKSARDDPVKQLNNIRYTLDAVELANRLLCKKFIGAGSQAEYGLIDEVITPTTRVEPQLSYGIAKYAAGKLSRKLCDSYHMTHYWCRIFSVYGIYDSPNSMINYALTKFIKGEKAEFSSAMQYWDYLFEDDAGEIFYRLGNNDAQSKVYCIASGDRRILKQYILDIASLFKNPVFSFDKNISKQVSLLPDISVMEEDIGKIDKINFKDGIKKVVESLQKHLFEGGGITPLPD